MTEQSDISELFRRDPMQLSDADIDLIIEDMRNKRHLFNANPGAVTAKKTLTEKQKKASSLKIDLDL